jgi:hypothetical protein
MKKKATNQTKTEIKRRELSGGGSSIFFLTQKIVSSNFTCGVSVSN